MSEKRSIVRGKYTRVNLAASAPFQAPWQPDPWGNLRAPYGRELGMLSAELSADVYELSMGRWFDAGWGDCTFQVENRILGGINSGQRGGFSAGRQIKAYFSLRQARAGVRVRPVGDVVRALRQLITTDTGKALVMARPLGADPEKYLVAICFMGTSRKFYDWFTNFKLTSAGGMHEGFSLLAAQFDHNADRILFPGTALSLGTERLALSDILSECARPESRFTLWLCGHSQGGAVVQAYAHRLMYTHGVLPHNILGYTFAAPTTVGADWALEPAAYPIYNLINMDDYVPRVGASMRLGVDMVFRPDDLFRGLYYGYDPTEPDTAYARLRFARMMGHVQDTRGALEMLLALCLSLTDMPDRQMARQVLIALNATFKYITPAMSGLGLPLEEVGRLLIDRLSAAYREVSGRLPDMGLVGELAREITRYILEAGPDLAVSCMLSVLFSPHHMSPQRDKDKKALHLSPYLAIAAKYADMLIPATWQPGAEPRLVSAEGETLLPIPKLLSLDGAQAPGLPPGE